MTSAVSPGPAAILNEYVTKSAPNLYVVGCFDKNGTVMSQQIRALNLAYALIEEGLLGAGAPPRRVAVVGGGFAGLTLAAGLLSKGVTSPITILEQRDTLLPLQQGSDTRWLHPRIYDWPGEGSEADAAMLPVLNWTAGRASDVAVQTLASWANLLDDSDVSEETLRLYCNTRHLQIQSAGSTGEPLKIEWVGERREAKTGNSAADAHAHAEGRSEEFDVVFLTVGFGLERDTTDYYWRNETFGQPGLNHQRLTRVISGGGDGALIDLLRVRISQYRQDRILDELFGRRLALRAAIDGLRTEYEANRGIPLFDRFEALAAVSATAETEFRGVLDSLRQRLRRDTDAVLRLRKKDIASLLNGEHSRVSFQNALLVYLLYRCGGFTPTAMVDKELTSMIGVRSSEIVRRHGPDAAKQVSSILSTDLWSPIKLEVDRPRQPDVHIRWPGGYFGFHGKEADLKEVSDAQRKSWRKEYLPGPTALVARTLCGSVAGFLLGKHPDSGRLRVTLHRSVSIGTDACLQQACDYVGRGLGPRNRSSSGRTLQATAMTIGLAYRTRRVVRSVRAISPPELRDATEGLERATTAQAMNKDVGYVLAIPILQPLDNFFTPSPVAGVLYLDSTVADFWLGDEDVVHLCRIIQTAVCSLEKTPPQTYDRIRNVQLTRVETVAAAAESLGPSLAKAFETLPNEPPATKQPFQFNFDHSDLTPLE
ncbi:hypothetical protein LJR219_005038 [Phenylobacterium sp. LjRoot219]|uniref:hypothetical protein n=1 Tax=Phenylobacterium sp. LjRoot219 TaxID=3342283 RepID=UPI003ECEA29E